MNIHEIRNCIIIEGLLRIRQLNLRILAMTVREDYCVELVAHQRDQVPRCRAV